MPLAQNSDSMPCQITFQPFTLLLPLPITCGLNQAFLDDVYNKMIVNQTFHCVQSQNDQFISPSVQGGTKYTVLQDGLCNIKSDKLKLIKICTIRGLIRSQW